MKNGFQVKFLKKEGDMEKFEETSQIDLDPVTKAFSGRSKESMASFNYKIKFLLPKLKIFFTEYKTKKTKVIEIILTKDFKISSQKILPLKNYKVNQITQLL